tara:strand:+ start:54 stop:443 length:390 start_codon:yes stop_codon:yes gene_type:complete
MKALLGALLLAVSLSAQAEELKAYQSVVSLKVLCSKGGPEFLMQELLDGYNEKPVHAMDISAISGLNIQMYITENKNNPTSTVLLHNQSIDKTCIFWSARDYLRTLEVESLPAKMPEIKINNKLQKIAN